MNPTPSRRPLFSTVMGLLALLAGCTDGGTESAAASSSTTAAVATQVAETPAPDRTFGGRDGQDDPVIITTVEELQAMQDDLDGHYALGADIDATSTESWGSGGFEPVGSSDDPFTGSLDGRGHVITGLVIDRAHDNQTGLFSIISQEAQITGVGLVEARVTGQFETGALVGQSRGSIWNSYSESGHVSGSQGTGGLVGELRGSDDATALIVGSHSTGTLDGGSNSGGLVGVAINAEISDSYTAGTVSGSSYLGGLVGWQNGSSITGSYSDATVSATRSHAGGLVGTSTGSISTSHSTGDVSGTEHVGGLVGHNSAGVTASFSLGAVTGTNEVGGLAGRNMGSIESAYSHGDVTGAAMVGGMVGSNQGQGARQTYSTGAVVGEDQVGGLAGFNSSAFSQSYWDAEQAGLAEPDNEIGDGKTSAELMQQATYEEWDFGGVWTITEGSAFPDLLDNPRR